MRHTLLGLIVLGGVLQAGGDAVSEAVAKAKTMSVEEHAKLVGALRQALDERLLTPGARWRKRFPAGRDAGVNRILNRGAFEGVTSVRGGGAYFSFTTASNDYDQAPDLGLQQWRFHSGFAGGDYGLVKVVPAKSLAQVTLEDVPFLLMRAPQKFYTEGREHEQKLRRQPLPPGAVGPPPSPWPEAQVGAVYVIRSVRWRQTDLVAAFEVLEQDRYGVTFAWKVLKRLPNPGQRR